MSRDKTQQFVSNLSDHRFSCVLRCCAGWVKGYGELRAHTSLERATFCSILPHTITCSISISRHSNLSMSMSTIVSTTELGNLCVRYRTLCCDLLSEWARSLCHK
jgi:hypothetical protein